MNFTELNELDALIRRGELAAARRGLAAFIAKHSKGIPRAARSPAAALARRLGLFPLALRILFPVVRPSVRRRDDSTEAERAEYAGALVQVGRVEEGGELLARISRAQEPAADLFEAFACFSEWRYDAAIPLLERYVAHPELAGYQRRIGQVNLAAALVIERQPRAAPLLAELSRHAATEGNTLLRGNLIEITAQDAYYSGEEATARALLEQAPVQENLLVRKWRAILGLKSASGDQARSNLRHVRADALRARNGETVRECDLFLACADEDETLLKNVYFGTPYPAYRRRVHTFSGRDLSGSEPFVTLGKGSLQQLDLRAPSAPHLKAGQLPHRLLLALAADLYRHRNIPSLHACLFPGSYYNPYTSPQQVHQALARLRLALGTSGLFVRERQDAYALEPARGRAWQLRQPEGESLREFPLLRALTLHGPFSGKAADAARVWNLPLRSAQRALTSMVAKRFLERFGTGRATRYRSRETP